MPTRNPTRLFCFAVLTLAAFPLTTISVRAAPGDLYMTSFQAGAIFKFTPNGTQSTFASGLNSPNGLAFDASGNLFVTNGQNPGSILEVTPSGVQTTFATGLNGPAGLAFDRSGNLFAANTNPGSILEFTPGGTESTFASGLSGPTGLAFDNSGNLFETDFFSGNIFEFSPNGTESTFATGLTNPTGLAFDSQGNLYVAIYGDHNPGSGAILKFSPSGTRSMFTGNLYLPFGLAFDASGNLFVGDLPTAANGYQILKFASNGTGSTFATGIDGGGFLAFQGQTLPVPEPSVNTLVAVGLSLLCGVALRRRHA